VGTQNLALLRSSLSVHSLELKNERVKLLSQLGEEEARQRTLLSDLGKLETSAAVLTETEVWEGALADDVWKLHKKLQDDARATTETVNLLRARLKENATLIDETDSVGSNVASVFALVAKYFPHDTDLCNKEKNDGV
jgi:hypothetical protein